MTTPLITETSSAPTLPELAAKAAAKVAERVADEQAEAVKIHESQQLTMLFERLSAVLGINTDGDYVVFDEEHNASVSIDGITFSVDCDDERCVLLVDLTCARGCGKAMTAAVPDRCPTEDSLAWLHEALGDTTRVHPFDCIKANDDTAPLEYTSPLKRLRNANAAIEIAGERLAQAVRTIQELEDGRSAEKSAAIRRLMQTTNEETQKAHSASSAEKVVETDTEYSAYRRRQADAEVEKHRAYAAYETAKRNADLALELFRVEERNR